jgi:hypothetical protein
VVGLQQKIDPIFASIYPKVGNGEAELATV